MDAVTEWFSPAIKPVHKGAYKMEDLPYPFHYWNGAKWLELAEKSPLDFKKDAIKSAPIARGGYTDRQRWRGLASDPKASKP
jgi:hypothetical protein